MKKLLSPGYIILISAIYFREILHRRKIYWFLIVFGFNILYQMGYILVTGRWIYLVVLSLYCRVMFTIRLIQIWVREK